MIRIYRKSATLYLNKKVNCHIENPGVSKQGEDIEGVTVVWLASPDSGGTVVVGWYKNTTVFREPQALILPTLKHKNIGITDFRIKAKWDDAFLLPIQDGN